MSNLYTAVCVLSWVGIGAMFLSIFVVAKRADEYLYKDDWKDE
jgi:hypothetical protein